MELRPDSLWLFSKSCDFELLLGKCVFLGGGLFFVCGFFLPVICLLCLKAWMIQLPFHLAVCVIHLGEQRRQ